MRLWAVVVSCVLVLGGSLQGMAQQQRTGPRTLEGLLNTDDAQKPAVAAPVTDATDAAPKRPAGAVIRPKNGVQHPDLDKAWADYDAAVAKVTEEMRAAINKQFDAATAKGDLDAAEKWQAALGKFDKSGELPAEKETKAAVSAAVDDCKEAREELAKAYEAVVKALTMEKKIAEAKAVRTENESLKLGVAQKAVSAKDAQGKGAVAKPKVIAAFVGQFRNAPNGDLQDIRENGTYVVNGNPSNDWSGTWIIEEDDPKGPCLVRNANNGTVTRFYVHPENGNILTHQHGLMHRLR